MVSVSISFILLELTLLSFTSYNNNQKVLTHFLLKLAAPETILARLELLSQTV